MIAGLRSGGLQQRSLDSHGARVDADGLRRPAELLGTSGDAIRGDEGMHILVGRSSAKRKEAVDHVLFCVFLDEQKL